MFKKLVAALAALLLAATAFAAVDANKATQAELEAITGIGPVISKRIIDARKKSSFTGWNDLVVRVSGVGDRAAAKFSEGGLTVNGKPYNAAEAAAAAPPPKGTILAKAASGAGRAADATKATAAKAASAVKSGAAKAASGTQAAATRVKESAGEQKDAVKENVAEAKAKRAEKKAEKADAKAAKAAAASAPAKK